MAAPYEDLSLLTRVHFALKRRATILQAGFRYDKSFCIDPLDMLEDESYRFVSNRPALSILGTLTTGGSRFTPRLKRAYST